MIHDELQSLLQQIADEEAASQLDIFLTAFENRPSKLVERMISNSLGHRYHLGTSRNHRPGDLVLHGGLMLRGLASVQRFEQFAHACAEKLFGAQYSEFRLLTGLHATTCTIACLTRPGDIVYSIDPADGGHFATAELLRRLGRITAYLPWRESWTGWTLETLSNTLSRRPPSAILVDCGVQLDGLDIRVLREVSGQECPIVFDASHTLGLIAGGQLESPLVAGADILQGNTHKTFMGPHRAIALFKNQQAGAQYAQVLESALVSSQLTNMAMALYVSIVEMMEFGSRYAQAIVKNANMLAEALVDRGWHVESLNSCSQYTATNLVLVKDALGVGPFEACIRLANVRIITNARHYRNHPILRLGVQEITRRGFNDAAIIELADLMTEAMTLGGAASSRVISRVIDLSRSFSSTSFSFDAAIEFPRSSGS